MLRKATELTGYAIRATDGDIGSVNTVFFDDDRWAVRYFVVDTGNWLPGRKVLISPVSIIEASWTDRALRASLTREQVEHSPDIDTQRPVSRQHEAEYFGYYGYPYYWGGLGLWGPGAYPGALAYAESRDRSPRGPMRDGRDGSPSHPQSPDPITPENSHLRDASVVTGYDIRAADGDIGHVEDFLVDDQSWSIRYLIVNTSSWLTGRRVLIAPSWVTSVSWEDSMLHVIMTRQAIEDSPEYDAAVDVPREYEHGLYAHYGRTGYWGDHDELAQPGAGEGHARGTDPTRQGAHGGGTDRLVRLEQLDDLEVADGDPDVRGWRVVTSDGRAVGAVEHLIIDRPEMKVRYLEVGLEGPATEPARTRDVLIPLEYVDLDEPAEEVRLATLPSNDVFRLPTFDGLPIDSGYEQRLQASFEARAIGSAPARGLRLDRQTGGSR